jgi:hypothetical protein
MPDNNSPASGSSLSGGSIDSDFPSLDEPGRVAPPLRQSVPNFVDTDFNKVVGDGERPASASQGPKSRILWRALFAIIVLCTIAYGVFLHAKRPNEQPAFPAGWIDLAACSDAISLDGTRQLALSEDQTAEMTETTSQTEGKNERKTRGKWSYDETAKKIWHHFQRRDDKLFSLIERPYCYLHSGQGRFWLRQPARELVRDV